TAERALDGLPEPGRLCGEHVRASVERATVHEHVRRPWVPGVTPPLLPGRLRHQDGDGVAVALVADRHPVLASGPAPLDAEYEEHRVQHWVQRRSHAPGDQGIEPGHEPIEVHPPRLTPRSLRSTTDSPAPPPGAPRSPARADPLRSPQRPPVTGIPRARSC